MRFGPLFFRDDPLFPTGCERRWENSRNWLDSRRPAQGRARTLQLFDGNERADKFEAGHEPSANIYMLKLSHLVDDKIHAR